MAIASLRNKTLAQTLDKDDALAIDRVCEFSAPHRRRLLVALAKSGCPGPMAVMLERWLAADYPGEGN